MMPAQRARDRLADTELTEELIGARLDTITVTVYYGDYGLRITDYGLRITD